MTFTPVSNDPFEHYFHKRAQRADDMTASGTILDANILATAALDALAKIWLNDFPDVKRNMEKDLGGGIPSSIRLSRLLKTFASHDPRVSKVAVVCFAEDWKLYRPQDTDIANRLLSKRLSDDPNEFLRAHELPKSYLDVSRNELTQECPELTTRPDLFALLENYEYGALLYAFYRCPLVHCATGSSRTHGFTRKEEIMYYPSSKDDRITISFGSNLITHWLRDVVSGYVKSCQQQGIVPANNFDAGTEQEKRLEGLWNRLT
ncbi:hypothetical protein [Lusitaniella coriacea]|uniref:hypothetical protein n=1 Tax=Lusitaniella coriacea TaxID=1983105 RepID=UPI003CFADF0B